MEKQLLSSFPTPQQGLVNVNLAVSTVTERVTRGHQHSCAACPVFLLVFGEIPSSKHRK